MSNSLANTANLSASTANSLAGNAVEPITAASFYLPAWLLVGGVLLALIGAIAILGTILSELRKKPKSRDDEFARMLCEQIWRHTDHLTAILVQRIRQQPGDIATLRILLRYVAEDLAGPLQFVRQMETHAPTNWPGYGLFGVFGGWAGQLRSMENQLGDLQRSIPYPVGNEPDTYRDQIIVYQALNELRILGDSVRQLRGHAFAICDAAKKSLKKDDKHGHDDDHDKEAHADCPCCKRSADHAPYAAPDPLQLPPLPPPPPKPAPAKPKIVVCHCAPHPCGCVVKTDDAHH